MGIKKITLHDACYEFVKFECKINKIQYHHTWYDFKKLERE